MSRISRFREIHFLELQMIFAILIGIVFLVWVVFFNGSVVVNDILNGNRSAIYGALSTVFGSLLGFVITVLSIIIGYSTNDKFEFLTKSKHFPTLWKVLSSTIKALSLATVVTLLGLIFDRDNPPKILITNINVYTILLLSLRGLIVFTTLLALLRLKRCIWVLENVVKIIIGI